VWQNEYATRLYEDNYICCVLVQPQNVAEFELKCRMLQPEHAHDQIEFCFWVLWTSSENYIFYKCDKFLLHSNHNWRWGRWNRFEGAEGCGIRSKDGREVE